jgi:predicted small metal-binding protein
MKELRCRDVGPDCDAVVRAESEEEILAQVVQHAKSVHDMTDEQIRDPAFQDHVRNQIHEQSEGRG